LRKNQKKDSERRGQLTKLSQLTPDLKKQVVALVVYDVRKESVKAVEFPFNQTFTWSCNLQNVSIKRQTAGPHPVRTGRFLA